jgi:uncharacterized DUF497 family protein
MQIGYDPQKNQKNILERGLSFDDVVFLDWEQALILMTGKIMEKCVITPLL